MMRHRARCAFLIRSAHAKQTQSHTTTGNANPELCRVEGPCWVQLERRHGVKAATVPARVWTRLYT
jgi:hypothetical protein